MSSFETICNQRALQLRNNVPLSRVEMLNPYTNPATANFTQFDYDMRRKAEILQYRSSRMSSQTNGLTKKQQFAMVARGNFISVPYTNGDGSDLQDVSTCIVDNRFPSASTSAGVPGPSMLLYLDKAVPLYNFGAPVRSYPFNVENTQNTIFRTDTNLNMLAPHNQETDFCMLSVNQVPGLETSYNFNFTFPAAISVAGVIENNGQNKTLPITVSVYQCILVVYYSNSVVQTVNVPFTLSSMTFQIADVNNQNRTGHFSALLYIGSITSPRIRLLTQAGFIYQIKILPRLTVTGSGTNYFSNISLNMILNQPSTVLKNEINCVITSDPSTIPNTGFTVTTS